jgi:glutamyl-tRNA reductase
VPWPSVLTVAAALGRAGTDKSAIVTGQESHGKVAFLGLGVMGYPMAGHLAAKGHEVTVYNRTAAKAEAWVAEHGGAHGAHARARRRGGRSS